MDESTGWTRSPSASPQTSFHKLSSASMHSRASDARDDDDDEFRKQEEFLQLDMTPPAHLVPRSTSSIGDFANPSNPANPAAQNSVNLDSVNTNSFNSGINPANPANPGNPGTPGTPGSTKRYSFHSQSQSVDLSNANTSANSSFLNRTNMSFQDPSPGRRPASVSEENSRLLASRMDGLNIGRSISATEQERIIASANPTQRAISPDSAARTRRRYENYKLNSQARTRPVSQVILSELDNSDAPESLSFHSEQYRLTPLSPVVPPSSFGPDSAFASRIEPSERMDGVRYRESLIRSLKDENVELKLKIQQMKEVNAPPDKSRSLSQLSRTEKRVAELENALIAKNRTIAQLLAENEQQENSNASAVNEHLMAELKTLQDAIAELETQAELDRRATSEVIAKASAEMPDIVSEKADTHDLVNVIKLLVNDGARLMRENDSMHTNMRALQQAAAESAETVKLLQHTVQTTRRGRDEDVDELRSQLRELGKQHELAARNADEARENTYKIIRSFFRTIIENCDEARNNEINAKLQEIVAKCQRKRVSKTPYLIKYMAECTQNVATTSLFLSEKRASDAAQGLVKDKECEVRSLEAILAQRFDKVGGDAFLRSQVSELKEALKREQERRHAEGENYRSTIAELQRK